MPKTDAPVFRAKDAANEITSIKVRKGDRKRLNIIAAKLDATMPDALGKLLDFAETRFP